MYIYSFIFIYSFILCMRVCVCTYKHVCVGQITTLFGELIFLLSPCGSQGSNSGFKHLYLLSKSALKKAVLRPWGCVREDHLPRAETQGRLFRESAADSSLKSEKKWSRGREGERALLLGDPVDKG